MSKFAEEESDREEERSLPRGEEAGLEPGLATLYGLALFLEDHNVIQIRGV